MINSEVLNNQITLQAIANSLDNITKSLSGFATKDDLKGFATKDDLKNFATKEDLNNFATKDDLKNFATKDDLKGFATKKDLEVFAKKEDLKNFATKDDLRLLTTNLEYLIDSLAITTKNEFERLHTKVDSLSAKVDQNHAFAVNQFDYVLSHYSVKEEYRQFATR